MKRKWQHWQRIMLGLFKCNAFCAQIFFKDVKLFIYFIHALLVPGIGYSICQPMSLTGVDGNSVSTCIYDYSKGKNV